MSKRSNRDGYGLAAVVKKTDINSLKITLDTRLDLAIITPLNRSDRSREQTHAGAWPSGSGRLPVTQEIAGSNPVAPAKNPGKPGFPF